MQFRHFSGSFALVALIAASPTDGAAQVVRPSPPTAGQSPPPLVPAPSAGTPGPVSGSPRPTATTGVRDPGGTATTPPPPASAIPSTVVTDAVPPVPASTPRPVSTNGDTALLRIFLKDGSSIVSFGEAARVDDRAVFSMPTSASAQPNLHLVTVPSDRVDWERTDRYAESVRATRYLTTRAEQDYALLSDEVAQALSDISTVQDAPGRLAIVERARKTLADWPPKHYNYKVRDVRQMLGILDEAIADLRAAAGLRRFDLNFVADIEPLDSREPLMPTPTPREAIEQTLLAATLSSSSIERVSLLSTALGTLDRETPFLDGGWASTTTASVKAMIDTEHAIDRTYQNLTKRHLAYAEQRARIADVRSIQNLLNQISADDKRLGAHRPEAVAALVGAVQEQLDAAQRLRLARDRWLLKSQDYTRYNLAVRPHLQKLQALKPALEDIKSLAGSTPAALQQIQSSAALILAAVSAVLPPEDLRSAHALLVSAAQLADSAARIRRDAALSGDISRAWNASSAAAGALMLTTRAVSDIDAMLKPPVPATK